VPIQKQPVLPTIGLGDVARDRITGFQGVVVCISQWLHGCRRMTLQPQDLWEGKPVESSSFDEPQLERLDYGSFSSTTDTGGPRPEPQRGR
jgi:hypothetical protein